MHACIARLTELTKALEEATAEQAWDSTKGLQTQRAHALDEIEKLAFESPDLFSKEDYVQLQAVKAAEDRLRTALKTATDELKQERRNITKGKAMTKAYGK